MKNWKFYVTVMGLGVLGVIVYRQVQARVSFLPAI